MKLELLELEHRLWKMPVHVPDLFLADVHGGVLVVSRGPGSSALEKALSLRFDEVPRFGRQGRDGCHGVVRSPDESVFGLCLVVFDSLFDDCEAEADAQRGPGAFAGEQLVLDDLEDVEA